MSTVPSSSSRSERTCIGCRERTDRSALLRMVVAEVDGEWSVVPDPRRRRPGRGASLHPTGSCLHLAERRRAFGRALRRGDALNLEPLQMYVREYGVRAAPTDHPTGKRD